MKVRLYVEGGADSSSKAKCRKAFRVFFEKLIVSGGITVIASGSRSEAYADFCLAMRVHRNCFNILLVDSEEPLTSDDPWQHLRQRSGDGWECPNGATADNAQLMVQIMEAWFLAQKNVIAGFYGQRFRRGSLPRHVNIEAVPKRDIYDGLEAATRETQKGHYHKTRHAFELLELLEPLVIGAASPAAQRLIDVLIRETA